jgi:hypothetical protein
MKTTPTLENAIKQEGYTLAVEMIHSYLRHMKRVENAWPILQDRPCSLHSLVQEWHKHGQTIGKRHKPTAERLIAVEKAARESFYSLLENHARSHDLKSFIHFVNTAKENNDIRESRREPICA